MEVSDLFWTRGLLLEKPVVEVLGDEFWVEARQPAGHREIKLSATMPAGTVFQTSQILSRDSFLIQLHVLLFIYFMYLKYF